MRVAIVAEPYIPVPPKKYGGTERVIYYLVKGLKERGHEVTLLASGDSKVDATLIPIVKKSFQFGKTPEEQLKTEKKVQQVHVKVRKMLRQLLPSIDIIHSHAFDLQTFQDFPNLTTLHGSFVFSKMRYFEKRQGLYYVSISANQQESFPELQYVGVVYNGLDPEEFPFVEKPDNYLCFIGRFDREKNPLSAIELALKLKMKLKMAGKVDFLGREYFNAEIKPHLDNPLIEFLGELDLQEKTELLSHARVNLHPASFREPFGLTVLEAAYCGTPTLATMRGSMPELIENGRTGILAEDFEEGVHHIEEVFAMDRKYISERSRLLFNYKTMAQQYEVAYNNVIEIFDKQREFQKQRREHVHVTRQLLNKTWKRE